MKIFKAEPIRHYQSHDMRLDFIDRVLARSEREDRNFNRHMFHQDFTMLFNYLNNRNGHLFIVDSNDNELTQLLLRSVQTRDSRRPVDEKIRALIEEISQTMLLRGKSYYYVFGDRERQDMHIAQFSAIGVINLFGLYCQWVPRRMDRNWDRSDVELPREARILDSSKVMRFLLSKPMHRMLTKQNRILASLDKYRFGTEELHAQVTHENPEPVNYFDFNAWKDTQDRALYRGTRESGWNGRKYDASKRSEFFVCHRLIRFRRNQLTLRDDILRQLSAELTKIGKRYNPEFAVSIKPSDELPSIKQLDGLEARLKREEVGFTEITDFCFKR
ncbi:MAG TPA: hypothetical protein VIN17_09935 [Paracoccaceae bacterium]